MEQKYNATLSLTEDDSSKPNLVNQDEIALVPSDVSVTNNHKSMYNNNNETDNYNFLISNRFDEDKQSKQDELLENELRLMCQETTATIARVERAYTNALPIDVDSAQFQNTPSLLALHNNMIIIKRGMAYCKLCFIKVNLQMEDMWWHIFTRKHMTVEAQTKYHGMSSYVSRFVPERVFIPFKMPMIDFIWDTLVYTRNLDVVLNRTFCISRQSCLLVYSISDTDMQCHLCDLKQSFQDPEVHLSRSLKHVRMMNLSLVLTELKEEFIREISPTKYHCGFCNILLPSLRDLMDHLRGTNHKENKLDAYNRLHGHVPLLGQLDAINNILLGIPFVPNWAGRDPPGVY